MSGTLEVSHLRKCYSGFAAVDDVSFTIRSGEILGYVGPNGAGKSTTVKMIIGLVEPSDGRILFDGRSIREDLAGFQSRLGYVPEEPNVYPFLSGREYLQLVGRLRGMPRRILEPKIDEFLQIFSLWDDRDSAVSEYSKGMRQKILLSAALLHNPQLLILDEPLSGLDVNTMIAIRELLHRLAAAGRTILYCSHELDIMEKICSRAAILRNGRIAADDTIENLRQSMDQTSLEGVFARMTQEESHAQLAARIVQVMQ